MHLVGLHIYYKMIHGPYNIQLMTEEFLPSASDYFLFHSIYTSYAAQVTGW